MIKILFIGDIVGKIGRRTVQQVLPKLKKELKPDLVVANAENISHGSGVTESALKEVMEAGVDWFTCGDHSFKKEKQLGIYDSMPILRPANYSAGVPGKGYSVISISASRTGGGEIKAPLIITAASGREGVGGIKGDSGILKNNKHDILLINLIGRVFMKMDYDCPFRKLDEILADKDLAGKNFSAIIIDIHAEATSEKVAMSHYADGRASAVFGTHTHIMTADHKITEQGTAHITDAGMAGFAGGCIGIEKESIINTFLTQIKRSNVIPKKGRAIFNSVLVSIDSKTGKAKKIKPITKFVEIK